MSLPLVCPYFTNPVHCFDDETRRPCSGLCGHTVCHECITVRRFSRCPVCGLSRSFSKVSVNYASITLIEDCREKFWEKWKGWMDTKTLDAGFFSKLIEGTQLLCSMCVEPVKIPRICLTCDEENLFKQDRWQWTQQKATVLKILQRVMCSNCAIDNHGGHEILKHNMNKKSKKLITMAIAQNALNMFKDTIENRKGVVDCFLRRLKIEIIGQNLLKVFEELEYIEEWKCGYLGELIKKELIKKYMENVDEKVLDLFGAEGNAICDCSRFHENLETFSRRHVNSEIHELVGTKPHVFESGCPLYSWKNIADVYRKYSTSEKEFCGVAAKIPPNKIDCPLCVYYGYSQHQKKYFLLECGVSIIGELCKTEMIPLDKCCLKCLDRLNDCQFLLSCEHQKKKLHTFIFTKRYHEKKQIEKRNKCYQNCFMKDSTLWNFVIINHMMADKNLYEVIMYEIEQTDGFVDCQLRKVRMKEIVKELYDGLHSVHFWDRFDHLSKPVEMGALFKSFKQQWDSFRLGNGEQKVALQCKCTVIRNKVLEKKLEIEKHEDLEIKMINMARYSMTEEIHGCQMEYSHEVELNKDVMEELENTVGFKSTGQETESTSVGDKQVKYLMEKLVSNIFPFAHLHCRNEEKQLFDNKIHQPYTGSCGHTICLVCIEKTPNEDCPVCGNEGSFEGHQLNEELVREIETIKRNAWEIFKELWNSEAADFGACSECYEISSDLYLCGISNFSIGSGWRKRFEIKSTTDVLKLSRHVLCQECASVQAHATGKVNSVPFWKHHLKKTNGIFLLELLEDDIGGENCELRQIDIQKNRKKLIEVLEELNYEKRQECGYDRGLIQLKLIEKLIENHDRSAKQQQPTEEKSCLLCVMIDYQDCANNRSQRYDWMNVFEHLCSNQSPRFEKCCIHCLLYLNNRYTALCQTKTEFEDIKNMSNAISEGIEEGQLKHFNRLLKFMDCNDCNNFVDDEETWRNLIIREYFFCLLQTITVGLSKTTFTCHLRKIRIHNLAYLFFSEVCDVWFQSNQYWIGSWKFIKTSSMVKMLKLQFKKLKDEMDKEETGVKCECTITWERNQKMIGHADCEEKRKFRDLEDSMEEMARFSLEHDLDGCPMEYDHGIELDEEIVNKLKG